MDKKEKRTNKFYRLFANLFLVILLSVAIICVLFPDEEYSSSEKRALASFPTLTVDALLDGSFMDGMEDWCADQFPYRNNLMQAKSWLSIQIGAIRSQGVYLTQDGSLMESFTMPSEEALDAQIQALCDFADRYPDSNFYYCLVPTAVSVLEDKLPNWALTDDQNTYIDAMKEGFASYGTFIDVRETFASAKDTTQLFYTTDHHWTTDAAYLAWQELHEAMELESDTKYTSGVVTNTFSGSLALSSGFTPSQYDAIKIYIPENNPVYTVTYNNTQTMTGSVYSLSSLDGDDPYQVFFGGNHPRITIKTAVKTDRKLLVIKDSYANCLIPFFLEDFSQITIIDPRYYYEDLDLEMQSGGYTDVLYLYNVNTLSQDNYMVPVLQNQQ